MRNKIKLISALLIIVMTISCKKDSSNSYPAAAIVEAYLYANHPITVKVTKEILYTSTDTTLETIDGLSIKLTTNGNSYTLTSEGNGIYSSDSSVVAIVGQTYNIEFDYNGKIINASTTIPTKPTGFISSETSMTIEQFSRGSGFGMPGGMDTNTVSLNWDNPDNDYFLVVVKNIDPSLTPIDTSSSTTDTRRPNFRNEPNQNKSYSIRAMSFQYYGMHNIILCKLNADYAALYKQTGNNSQNLTKPVSNIKNGLGIFTGINADTLNINIIE